LARLSVNVAFNSYESYPPKGQVTLVLSEIANTTTWKRRVIVCRYVIESETMRVRKLSYWSEEMKGAYRRIVEKELEALQDWCDYANLEVVDENAWTPPSELERVISQDFDVWCQQQWKLDRLARGNQLSEDKNRWVEYPAIINLRS